MFHTDSVSCWSCCLVNTQRVLMSFVGHIAWICLNTVWNFLPLNISRILGSGSESPSWDQHEACGKHTKVQMHCLMHFVISNIYIIISQQLWCFTTCAPDFWHLFVEVMCGISALALKTNAPTILREEALTYSDAGGATVFGSSVKCAPEKVIAANASAALWMQLAMDLWWFMHFFNATLNIYVGNCMEVINYWY